MDKIKLQIPVVLTKFIEVEVEVSEAKLIGIGKDLQQINSLDLDLVDSDDFLAIIEENTEIDIHEQISENIGKYADVNWAIDDILDYEVVNLFPTTDEYNIFQTKLNQLTKWENP